MNTEFRIKNFRVFDEEGVTLDIKPITILTGCNSSGKSSIVKAISLLSQFVQNIIDAKKDGRPIKLNEYKLDFTVAPNNLLGDFGKIVNKNAKDKTITFAYKVYSSLLCEEVEIEYTFGELENDFLHNGYLRSVVIRNSNSEVLFSSSDDETLIDYILLKLGLGKWIENRNHNSRVQDIFGDVHFNEKQIANDMIQHDLIAYMPFLDELDGLEKKEVEKTLLNRLEKKFKKKFLETVKLSANLSEDIRKYILSTLKKDSDIICDMKLELLNDKELLNHYYLFRKESYRRQIRFVTDLYMKSEFRLFSDYLRSIEKKKLSPFHGLDLSRKIFSNKDFNWLNIILDPESEYYSIISILRMVCSNDEENHYWIKERENQNLATDFVPFYLMNECVSNVLTEILSDSIMEAISYISSDLVTVKRLYSFDAKDDFTILLKEYLEKRNQHNSERVANILAYYDNPFELRMGDFTNKWLQQFGIAHHMIVESIKEGAGVQIRIYESEEDKIGRISADYGYGVTQLIALLLSIEINKGKTIAIEEPEIHLHPSYQSKLAELFVEASEKFQSQFIIETHSEYLIRKLQTLVLPRNKRIDRELVSVLYINDADVKKREIGEPHVKKIEICANGYLDDNFGTGFFDESIKSIRELQK